MSYEGAECGELDRSDSREGEPGVGRSIVDGFSFRLLRILAWRTRESKTFLLFGNESL